MRAAIIENGVVTNVIEVESLDVFPGLIDGTNAAIGALWDGSQFTAPAPVTPTIEQYTAAVQQHLDTKAQERNYDGILSACTYVTSTNAQFQAEAQACVAWRDAVWAHCYATMNAVLQGQQAAPTIDELVAGLPAMAWQA